MATFRSMTGYGRAVLEADEMQLVAELSAVNRKHLDINIFLPRHFTRFDSHLRKLVAASVFRGHVTLRLSISSRGRVPLEVHPNLGLARQLFAGWKQIAEELGGEEAISLNLLAKEPELFIFDEIPFEMEKCAGWMAQAVEEALHAFNSMRLQEGAILETEIKERIRLISEKFQEISALSLGAAERHRLKLLERLKQMLPELNSDEERVLREVALFADRVDISEELTRFDAHLAQFSSLMDSKEVAAGKKAEFILQELSREINTIGSKASELLVTRAVIEIKSELEKIREQIQNVE